MAAAATTQLKILLLETHAVFLAEISVLVTPDEARVSFPFPLASVGLLAGGPYSKFFFSYDGPCSASQTRHRNTTKHSRLLTGRIPSLHGAFSCLH